MQRATTLGEHCVFSVGAALKKRGGRERKNNLMSPPFLQGRGNARGRKMKFETTDIFRYKIMTYTAEIR